MSKTRLICLILVVGLGMVISPTHAQEDLNAILAEAAASNFLVTLAHPHLSDTMDFYLLDSVKTDPILADLKVSPITTYEIIGTSRLETDAYQTQAKLQPGNRVVSIVTRKHRDRWLIAALELKAEAAPALAPPPAASSSPGDLSGKLVFQTYSGGNIYIINADGTGLRWVTKGIDPQLSPDGTKIAFTRWDGAEFGTLHILDLESGTERVILSNSRQAKSPTWSPDGSEIVFSFQSGGRRELLENCRHFDFDDTINLPNDRKLEIKKVHVGENGITICYVLHPDLQWRLHRVNVETGTFEDVPSDLYSYGPTWHPTNPDQWIYKGELSLILYDARANTTQAIGHDFQDHTPVISPDGKQILTSYWQHDHWEVHMMNIDGSNRQRLTRTPLTVLARKDLIVRKEIAGALRFTPTETQHWNNAAPTWSPNGRHIAFLTDRTGKWEIWIMPVLGGQPQVNADGSDQRPMFSNGVLDELTFVYAGVDERMLSWRDAPGVP